jgi:hypothetical protein
MNQPQNNMTSHCLFPNMKYQPDGLDAVPHSPARHSKKTIRPIPPQTDCFLEHPNTKIAHGYVIPMQEGHFRRPMLLPKKKDSLYNASKSETIQYELVQKGTRLEDWDNRTATTSTTITTYDSSVPSSLNSWHERTSVVPKQKEDWYGKPLVLVQQRFSDELQQLRHENDILRRQCQTLQQQLQRKFG